MPKAVPVKTPQTTSRTKESKSSKAGAKSGTRSASPSNPTGSAKKTARTKTQGAATSAPRQDVVRPTPSSVQELTPEERYKMIQEAAYHIAEKDGFQPGKEHDYWYQAEREMEERFKERESMQPDDMH